MLGSGKSLVSISIPSFSVVEVISLAFSVGTEQSVGTELLSVFGDGSLVLVLSFGAVIVFNMLVIESSGGLVDWLVDVLSGGLTV